MVDGADPRTARHAALARLNCFVKLDEGDSHAIDHLCRSTRRVAAHRDIVSEGDRALCNHVILEGWACRYKTLRDGSRNISALLIPGDFFDLRAAMLDQMDHGIAAITPVKVASISNAEFETFVESRPNLIRALRWATLVDLAVLRTWMAGLSRRSALGRVAHLLCELRDRSVSVGIGNRERFPFPLTQIELGDATGQTAVHTNRVLRQLRDENLVDIRGGQVLIFDEPALERVAEYEPHYLHLQHAPQTASRLG